MHSCIVVYARQCKHALSVLDNQSSCSKSATATYTKLDLFVVVRDKCYLHTSVSISSLEDKKGDKRLYSTGIEMSSAK